MPRTTKKGLPATFSEASAWDSIGEGWRPLFGSFRELGFSFEWHDFTTVQDLDWSRSFHPGALELCLNLEGRARLSKGDDTVDIQSRTVLFYFQGKPPLAAMRRARERHRFITVEFAPAFLTEYFNDNARQLHPLVKSVIAGEATESAIAPTERISTAHLQLVESLRQCPVFQPAQAIWFRCKALELAAHLFFKPAGDELFCTRAQRMSRERVERAQVILRERLEQPPALDELGKLVGCSPFYLSRQFTREAGVTIQQFIRQVRMERAAELLRTGKCNVTEAAFAVGYSSLSHFSTTFHETYGCCPGLYPLKTVAQQELQAE